MKRLLKVPRYILYYIVVTVFIPIRNYATQIVRSNMLYVIESTLKSECAICLEIVNHNDAIYNAIVVSCVHINNKQFHADCINRYIFNEYDKRCNRSYNNNNGLTTIKGTLTCKCPLCRNEFTIKIIQ